MSKFSTRKLKMLSPDADDWNELIDKINWPQQENALYGALLYPNDGLDAEEIEQEVKEYIESSPIYAHGSVKIVDVEERGKDWKIIYHIIGWYNHFNLTEEYD